MKYKKIAILGFGIEGQALLKFLCHDKSNLITVCDAKTKDELEKIIPKLSKFYKFATFCLGPNYLNELNGFDVVYRSPGIPFYTQEIQKAKCLGVKISSATKLFFELFCGTVIGITGTKGKGTTATLIYKILKASNKKVILGGNIGVSLLSAALKLGKKTKNYIAVLELSSFQLQDLEKSPNVAVFLNFSSDHLNHHKKLAEYLRAKTKIIAFQKTTDSAVLNYDDATIARAAKTTLAQKYYFSCLKKINRGVFVKNGKIIFKNGMVEKKIININQIKLKGAHNLQNILAAIATVMLFKPNISRLKNVIQFFNGLSHRLEFVASIKGIKYYNDSSATNTSATIAAIKSFNAPTIFILGGSSKGEGYDVLGMAIIQYKVKGVILIGQTADEIQNAIFGAYKFYKDKYLPVMIKTSESDMINIVSMAKSLSVSGDSIVLSPAAASFDMFSSYKERGDIFKQAVKKLSSCCK